MKKLIVSILFCIIAPSPISADEKNKEDEDDKYDLEWVTGSSGVDATSSGFAVTGQLKSEKWLFTFSAQSEKAWVRQVRKLGIGVLEFNFGWSFGHSYGALCVGPFASIEVPITKSVTFSSFHWPGIYSEEPEPWKTENDGVPNPERFPTVHMSSFRADIGPFNIGSFAVFYSLLNFLDQPWNELPGIEYTLPEFETDFGKLEIIVSGTLNGNEGWRVMPYIGIRLTF